VKTFTSSGSWRLIVIRLDIEIWVIGKLGTKNKAGKEEMGGRRGMGAAEFCGLFVSVVAVVVACGRECKGPWLCTVGTVG
jgi:hypothetical protein